MSKDKISDYSATANSNTDIGGINIDEGCAPSGINDAIRTLMKQLKDWQSGSQDVYIHPAGSASVPSITATGDTNTGLFFPAADTVGITTGGTERARVDSSGNLGLGVTPSAWTTYTNVLQTPGLALATNGTAAVLGANWYYDGQNRYKTNGYSTLYIQSAGTHSWFTAASGTAGNTLSSLTQAMTLDASGNLGIGTTSPSSRLHATSTTGVIATLDGSGTTSGAADTGAALMFNGYSGTETRNFAQISGYKENGTSGNYASYLSFSTRANGGSVTERARIDSNGNLLVGTTSVLQSSQVSISSSGKPLLCQVNAASTTGTPAARFVKYDNNTTTSNKLIDFEINAGSAGSGQINANGANAAAFGSYSDARLKENIVDLSPQLENILALRPAEFDYIESEGGGHQIGFIAQEMQTVYPDVIGEDEDGMLTITGWSKTEARLVKAIQELNAKFEAYKAAHP